MNGSFLKNACQHWLDSLAITRQQIIVIIILLLPLIAGLFITHGQKSKRSAFQISNSSSENHQLTVKVAEIESLWYDIKSSSRPTKALSVHKKLNLNQASQDELTSLPGIGATLAQRIVAYREQKGKFTTVEELVKVQGIGKKKFEKIEPYLVVK